MKLQHSMQGFGLGVWRNNLQGHIFWTVAFGPFTIFIQW